MNSFIVPAFNDMHVHFRERTIARHIAQESARYCENVLAMPNLISPLMTSDVVNEYRRLVSLPGMEALVAAYLTPQHMVSDICDLFDDGCHILKVYPKAKTTHSGHGLTNYKEPWDVWAKAEQLDMTVCFHGEHPQSDYAPDAEKEFIDTVFMPIRSSFPRLKIVLEHITTAYAVETVRRRATMGEPTYATITAHHLFLSLNDVIGGNLKTLNFCKPIAKRPNDRVALVQAAISGDNHFFLGSDSAPHTVDGKYLEGCAGCFTAPILPNLLAQIFDDMGAMKMLSGFTSQFGREFYGLPVSTRVIRLTKRDNKVPQRLVFGPCQYPVFMGGETLRWDCDPV